MKLMQIYEVLNEFAPLKLSEELCSACDSYDNSGIIADCGGDINYAVFSLDLTMDSVAYAVSVGAKLIVTHHPAIFYPVKNLPKALTEAVKNGISVISMHLNFDCAKNGVDYFFASGLGAKEQKIMLPLSEGGYGRNFVCDLSLGEFVEQAKNTFGTDKIISYGDNNRKVGLVASFCGAGLDEKNVLCNADTLVSADIRHHILLSAIEEGKNVVCITHYAAENFGMKHIGECLSKDERLKNLKIYFFDDERFL